MRAEGKSSFFSEFLIIIIILSFFGILIGGAGYFFYKKLMTGPSQASSPQTQQPESIPPAAAPEGEEQTSETAQEFHGGPPPPDAIKNFAPAPPQTQPEEETVAVPPPQEAAPQTDQPEGEPAAEEPDLVKAPERMTKVDTSFVPTQVAAKQKLLTEDAISAPRDAQPSLPASTAVQPLDTPADSISIIHLKNGHQVEGNIHEQDGDILTLENEGASFEIKKNEIDNIENISRAEFRKRVEAAAKVVDPRLTPGQEVIIATYDDKIIQGTLLKIDKEQVELLMDQGTFIIKKQNIRLIEKKSGQ